jgi:hypothetical protein
MGGSAMSHGEDEPFLKVIVHDLNSEPSLTGLCAGYERDSWRARALADQMLESLPDFCLSWSECQSLSHGTAVKLVRAAAQRVYSTDKFRKRGEFGELLLHVILKDFAKTLPAISKIFYKDSDNDTVKGFDAVHVVATDEHLELWLGEVKFYEDINRAIRDVVDELKKHTDSQYLRREFCAIANKIDNNWPHAASLRRLIDEKVSLDEIFDATAIPILLTYDGSVTSKYTKHCEEYSKELLEEFKDIHRRFAEKRLPRDIHLHLFLMPTNTKKILIEELDKKLKAWQTI